MLPLVMAGLSIGSQIFNTIAANNAQKKQLAEQRNAQLFANQSNLASSLTNIFNKDDNNSINKRIEFGLGGDIINAQSPINKFVNKYGDSISGVIGNILPYIIGGKSDNAPQQSYDYSKLSSFALGGNYSRFAQNKRRMRNKSLPMNG